MADAGAWSQGWALGSGAAQHGLARKEMLSDEERQLKATDLINTRNSILAKLPSLLGPNGEKTDEYNQAYQYLTQAQQGLGELYHPEKAPGALQKDWHFLLEKMHGIPGAKGKSAPAATPQAVTSQTPAAPLSAPASPITTPALPGDAGQPATPPATLPGMSGVPKGATPTMAIPNPKGLVQPGNIPIWNRPSVLNDDGTHSSELSISVGDDKGHQTLIPLIVDGKFLTPNGKMPPGEIPHNADEWAKASPEWKALKMNAEKHYQQTGQHLGKFGGDTAEDDVDAYAQVLHNRGSVGAQAAIPAGAPTTVAKTPSTPPVSWSQAQVLKQRAAAMQKAQRDAALLAAGIPLSPTQQAMSTFLAQNAVKQAQIESTLKTAESLGLSETEINELKQQLVGLKATNTFKPLPGAAGQPTSTDGGKTFIQYGTAPDGTVISRPMPAGYKPNTKAVRGTLINTKEHGFIQTWVNPYDPSKIVGWQKVTPGRQYTGTSSSSSSTDPFGVTTSTSRTTMPTGTAPVDFDFSGVQELPAGFNGEEAAVPAGQEPPAAPVPPKGTPSSKPATSSAPPPSVAKPATGGVAPKHSKPGLTPAELRAKVPSPPQPNPPAASGQFQVDANGHIPEADIQKHGLNSYLVQIANNLLDGTDVSKVPFKDRGAAEELAKKYGWGGQGMFTPRETLQIKEGASFLNKMANSPSLKVLDNGFFSNLPMMGSSIDPVKEGFFGKVMTNLASREQTPQQREFMDLYRQLDAMAVGLRALVQSGRGTQKQTDLLISELPNPINTPSSADARRRLQLVQNELDIAAKTGHLRGVEEMQDSFNSSSGGTGMSLDEFKKKHNLK